MKWGSRGSRRQGCAAGIPQRPAIAAELGDGLFATEPDADLVSTWRRLDGHGPAYAELPLAWAPDEDTAVQAVLDKSAFALTGWKVMAELPNPANFEAATASIGPERAREQFACGPDVKCHLQVAQQFVDAGFDHLVTMNAGPRPRRLHRLLRPRARRPAQGPTAA